MSDKQPRTNIGIVDIARVISGILLLNAFASWWFTSSSTWGYSGKWIDRRYIKHLILDREIELSPQELSLRNGSDPRLPIYIAINGSVYDVTASRGIYGPRGAYSFFSGKESARAFVTGCFQKEDEFTHDLRGLDPQEATQDIERWQKYFENSSKYWYVGKVTNDPLTGEPPEPCVHQKYPH